MENNSITKEEFLYNAREDEVFSLLHEFKERFNELVRTQELKDTNYLTITDAELGIIAEQMITELKGSVYL